MGSEHPKFKAGQRKLSAKDMNVLSRDAELAGKTRTKGGKQTKIPGVGQVIDVDSLASRREHSWDLSHAVIVRKSPATEPGWVDVQRVRYENTPPKPCTAAGCNIVAYGTTISARPEFGMQDDSYKDFVVAEGAAINADTAFLRVRYEEGIWILTEQAKGGGNDVCVVHAPFNGGAVWSSSSIRIRVVHIKKLPDPSTTYISAEPQLMPDGTTNAPGYSIVRCWPGTNESFWQYIKGTVPTSTPPILASNYVAVGTMMIGGVEYISPIIPVAMFTPNTTLLAGDC